MSAQPGIEIDGVAVGVKFGALHRLVIGLGEPIDPQRDPNRLVDKVFLQVLEDLAARGFVQSRAGFLDKRIQFRIVVMTEIQAGPDVGRIEPQVRMSGIG